MVWPAQGHGARKHETPGIFLCFLSCIIGGSLPSSLAFHFLVQVKEKKKKDKSRDFFSLRRFWMFKSWSKLNFIVNKLDQVSYIFLNSSSYQNCGHTCFIGVKESRRHWLLIFNILSANFYKPPTLVFQNSIFKLLSKRISNVVCKYFFTL